MSSSISVARLATVQTVCSLTNQVHELHRLDGISVSHQVNLSMQFTSLYFVMMSCNSELPTFRRRLQHSRVKLNGRLAGIISLLALGFARRDAPTSSPGGTP